MSSFNHNSLTNSNSGSHKESHVAYNVCLNGKPNVIPNNIFIQKDNKKTIVENLIKPKTNELGFIITRHVRCLTTNKFWIECYQCIRKFYPNNKILIIDDNSDQSCVSSNNLVLTDCEIINSEFPGRGELLAYYYFYKTHMFDKAIFIHDSVFIQQHIDVSSVNTVRFLMDFTHDWDMIKEEKILLKTLKNHDSLLELHDQQEKWLGCFGVMTVMTHEFLSSLVDKHELFNLLDHIKCREDRKCLERVFAVICNGMEKKLRTQTSLFGNHFYYMISYMCKDDFNKAFTQTVYYSFYDYMKDKHENLLHKFPVVKILTGR